jgi:cyclic lactone autoinducer peptide
MEFLSNIISKVAESTASTFTIWMLFDEPECPEELI